MEEVRYNAYTYTLYYDIHRERERDVCVYSI